MQHRTITEAQASSALQIIREECNYRIVRTSDADAFIFAVRTDNGRPDVCHEYRFMGALGYGGKFRNNGNRDNTPHVDCYREDETPERKAMIVRANKRLAELFK